PLDSVVNTGISVMTEIQRALWMGIELSDLWRWRGKIGRLPYLVLGVALFLMKSQLDRFVARAIFHQPWSLLSYLNPGHAGTIASIAHADQPFYATLVA